jgi:uncharacterized membrane protein
MGEASPLERARKNVTQVVSVLVTGTWMAALFTGQPWWLAALLVGYIVVVPLTALLFGDEDDVSEWWDDEESVSVDASATDQEQLDALQTLRERYARGEITDEQFERKVERLLETETLEDVEDRTRDRRVARRAPERDDREREREFS